jgi:3,4-dihydroxy-9,10-secoandrosta-1,3,5(10)-triene-9,17-dione 4,5-dioxygenase
MNIRGLGYVGFACPEPKAWLSYGTEVLGLMPARAVPGEGWGEPGKPGSMPPSGRSGIAPDGSVYLKLDDWQWRIAVHPGEPGLRYLGLELGSQQELGAALAELAAAGHPVELATPADAAQRAVTGLARTRDPAGNTVELFYGPTVDRKFLSPHGVRFATGSMGLGHLMLVVDRLAECQEFYTGLLGFRLTDYVRFGPDMSANFYHCNERHHSIGLIRVGPINGLHHLMLEVEEIDEVGKCLTRVEAAGIPVTSSLGRHVNDRMFSFYMRSPSGFDIEVGCHAIKVGPDWTPSEFVEGDVWGHKGLDAEALRAGTR